MALTGNITGTVLVQSAIRRTNTTGIDSTSLSITQTGTNCVDPSVKLPAGLPGTLTTYTDGTHGIVTTTNPHGLAGTEKIGLFWLDPSTGAQKKAYGCTITAHDASTYTFTVGAGDALPVITTAMTTAVAQTITDVVIPGSSVVQLTLSAGNDGLCNLYSVTPTLLLSKWLTAAGPYIFPVTVGASPDFSATCVSIDCYNAATVASTMTVEALLA
jgi:hypothetical protein